MFSILRLEAAHLHLHCCLHCTCSFGRCILSLYLFVVYDERSAGVLPDFPSELFDLLNVHDGVYVLSVGLRGRQGKASRAWVSVDGRERMPLVSSHDLTNSLLSSLIECPNAL